MQKIEEYSLNYDECLMATVDICFRIENMRNLGGSRIGPLYFSLSANVKDNQAVPYQIIQHKSSSSNIDMQSYNTNFIICDSNNSVNIQQICIFKIHVPVSQLQYSALVTKCAIKMLVNDEHTTVCQFEIKHQSLLGIHCYLPYFFNRHLCSIQITLHSHLLSVWYDKAGYKWNHEMYQSFNQLVISYNRLKQRLQEQPQNSQAYNKSHSYQNLQSLNFSQNEDFQLIKQYFSKRIFKPSTSKDHQSRLQQFLRQNIPYVSANLLQLWKKFIKHLDKFPLEIYRQKFINDFASETRKRVFCSQQFNQKYMNINGIKIMDSNIKITGPLKMPSQQQYPLQTIHIVVLVHGLGASSSSNQLLQSTLKYLYPNLVILNSKSNQNSLANSNPTEMGRNLAIEIFSFLDNFNYKDFELSFIGHSMGGLIIRSALPQLQNLKYSMKHYISLGTPHLGYTYHNSNLTKIGMWALQKIYPSDVIQALLMKDNQNPRESYLYRLSILSGLNWFRSITFFGCESDKYVGPTSAMVNQQDQIIQKSINGDDKAKIWQEMRQNINHTIQNIATNRLMVKFTEEQQGTWKQRIVGRASHVAYLSSQKFINSFLLTYCPFFTSQQH